MLVVKRLAGVPLEVNFGECKNLHPNRRLMNFGVNTFQQFSKLDQEFCLEEVSGFSTVDVSQQNPEDLWGPVPLHHIPEQRCKKFPAVRVADYRLVPVCQFLKSSAHRVDTINSKSFIGQVSLRIKWNLN